jgi:hypothetical protein
MRYIMMLSLLFFTNPAFAQTQAYFQETQVLTRAIPSGNPSLLPITETRPLPLATWTRYRITVCPTTGYALTGTGSIRLYLYNQYMGKWGYSSSLDQAMNITGSVVDMCQTFGFEVDVRKGWLHPATINVGVTGGTTVTVRVEPDNI